MVQLIMQIDSIKSIKPTTQDYFRRVSDLVEGFETPFGLELLATVHWVIKNETIRDIDNIVSNIYRWNDRKKQFTVRQIELATNVLDMKNWITLAKKEYVANANV